MKVARRTQSVTHQPFPIADMDVGEYTAKEPWLAPSNAFSDISDGFIYRSRLRRRGGFKRFGQCGVASAGTLVKSVIVADSNIAYSVTPAGTRVVGESVRLTWNDPVNGTINAECAADSWGFHELNGGDDAWGWEIVESGTTTKLGVFYQTSGAFTAVARMDWTAHSDYTGNDAADGNMTWAEDADLPLVGLFNYRDTTGEEYLAACNTTRFFYYDAGDGYFKDPVGSDSFTGAESDLFWSWPAGDDLIITNGIDAIKKFTGSSDTIANLTTTIGAGPSTVSAAKIAVLFQNRLILLNNVEGGTTYRGRGRWSRAGAYETYDTADFADAPSEFGAAVTAEFISDRLFVGFENGWMELVYTQDEAELFKWQKTTFVFGARARMGTIPDGPRLLTRTVTGIQAIDPNSQYAADSMIPDYVLDSLDTAQADFCSAKRVIADRQFWWAAVNSVATSSRPNEIVVAQYQEDADLRWSSYSVPFNCFADWTAETTPTLDDVDVAWDDYDLAWDSSAGLAGYPITLCGHADGSIYQYSGTTDKINDDLSTDPVSIPFSATTERLSPYPGMRSHLGWVDIYAEVSSQTTLSLSFRGDSDESAYKTTSVELNPTGSYQKVMRRVMVNKTATFHRMTLSSNNGGSLAIDAIIPWFRPAGRMRNFG